MRVQIIRKETGPKILIDGSTYEPIAFRSFRPEARNIREFHDAGVRLMSVLSTGLDCTLFVPYSTFGETWVGPEEYDFGPLDRQIELFLKNAPEAYFNLMIQLDTRPWYLEKHPETSNTFYNLVEMAGYDPWRRDARAYLLAFIDHAERRYGDRIFAYSLFCGTSTEWYTNSQARNEESRRLASIRPHPIKEEAFRRFLRNPGASLPDMEELTHTTDGVFRSPTRDRRAIDYWRFHNEIIADAALYFAAAAKERTGRRKLVGLFYGYLFELTGTRFLREGHMGYEQVWQSPDIDLLFSPAAYGATRAFDGTSGFLHTVDSIEANGKLCFQEIDLTTHVAPETVESGEKVPGSDARPKTAFEVRMMLRREYSLCAVKRTGMWWFDFFGGYYYDPELMKEVALIRRIQDRVGGMERRSVSQIAVFGDVQSMYYLDETSDVNHDLLRSLRDQLARVGAPADYCNASQLAQAVDSTGPHRSYRLLILPNLFAPTPEQHRALAGLPEETSLLFSFAPGVIREGAIDDRGISQITGMGVRRLSAAELGWVRNVAVQAKTGTAAPREAPRSYDESAMVGVSSKQNGILVGTVGAGPAGAGPAGDSSAISLPDIEFGFTRDIEPLYCVDDSAATPLACYRGTNLVALAARKVGGRLVFYSAVGNLPYRVLRELARAAGVFIYSEGDDPIYVCDSLIGVHHLRDAEVALRVPSDVVVEDLFDGGTFRSKNRRLSPAVEPGVMKLYGLHEGTLDPTEPVNLNRPGAR